ncbi:glycosyltransferase [Xanthobacter autotrophicus]|uniref:glycosyltransferase n=1 Tax=Xanthobacter autotrophicus TaxID=280 RepID=UPI0024A6919A|nr:nucleotide disphospho-sugar-binding domain-containing protein [Xanthobacter autotrophicus]MDI4658477.1 glycosyltransferase [Xanthobacter autotrophicus]
MEPTLAPTGRLRIVVAGWEGGGNVPPTLAAVEALCARGHDVTLVADDSIASDARAAGAHFVGWKRAPNRPDRSAASAPVRDGEWPDPFAVMAAWSERVFLGPSEAHARDLIDVMTVRPTDLLIASDLLFGSVLAGEVAQIPTAVLAPNVSLSPLPGHPPFGPGFLPAASAADHARDRAAAGAVEALWNGFLPHLNAARTSLGLQPLARALDQMRAADLQLLATSAAFDFPVAGLPGEVRYIGPLLREPSWAAGRGDGFEGTAGPRVLVSFSTTEQGQRAVLARLVEVLGALPVEAIVTLGDMLEASDLPARPNVRVVASASHEAILPRATLAITHGGHGTTLRALRHGVPLLVLPMGRDQNENAARVEYHGAGLRLDPASDAGAIAAAICRLIDQPAFVQNARRIADALRAEAPARERFVAEIEDLAARRRARPTCAA